MTDASDPPARGDLSFTLDVVIQGLTEGATSANAKAIVDTGASLNIFSLAKVKEVGGMVVSTPESVRTLSGLIEVSLCNIKVKVGLNGFQYMPNYVLEDWPWDDVDAVLGSPFLQHASMQLEDGQWELDPGWSHLKMPDSALEELRAIRTELFDE